VGICRARVGLMAAIAIAIAAAALSALSQDSRRMSLEDSRVDLFHSGEGTEYDATVTLQGRYAVPLGSIDLDGALTDYFSLFDAGLGVSGEASLLYKVGRWHIGPYLSIGWGRYEGKLFRESPVRLVPDDLNVNTFLVGPRFLLQKGRHTQLDLHMAFGVTHYSEVDGTFTNKFGGTRDGTVFNSSEKFAFDFGLRFNVLIGPVTLDADLGIRSQGGPTNGEFHIDPGAMVTLGLEFGAGLHF